MKKLNFGAFFLFGLVAMGAWLVACDGDAKNALKSELNKTNYNLVDPANDWTYAGGIAVYDTKNPKAGTAFYGLPRGVQKPQTETATAAWGADEINSNFTAQTLLSGIGSILNLGFAFDKSKHTTLAQISASGARLTNPELIVQDATVANKVKSWLSGGQYKVYIVSTALTTTNLSAKISDSTGVAGAFGSDVKQCTASTGSNTTGDVTSGGGTTGETAAGGNTTTARATTRANTAGGSAGTIANSSTGTGVTVTAQVCKTDDSTFTLATQTPLVFATLTNEVELGPNDTLVVRPVPGVTRYLLASQKPQRKSQAAILSGKWKQQAWPVQ